MAVVRGLILVLVALALPAATAADEPRLRLLVTGDSMVQPLDREMDRKFSPSEAHVAKDARPGTGISRPVLLDWPRHAAHQTKRHRPDAVVVFIGAGDSEPLPTESGPEAECCRQSWIDAYAKRVKRMQRAYLRRDGTRVYWLTLPTPRRESWRMRFNALNLAFRMASEDVGDRVRLIDTIPVLTPGNRYRAAVTRNGRRQIVRDRDGIHLNKAGSRIVRDLVLRQMRADGLID